MKIYNVPMDSFIKELVLTALANMTCRNDISAEARENYRNAYTQIKKSIVEQ